MPRRAQRKEKRRKHRQFHRQRPRHRPILSPKLPTTIAIAITATKGPRTRRSSLGKSSKRIPARRNTIKRRRRRKTTRNQRKNRTLIQKFQPKPRTKQFKLIQLLQSRIQQTNTQQKTIQAKKGPIIRQ